MGLPRVVVLFLLLNRSPVGRSVRAWRGTMGWLGAWNAAQCLEVENYSNSIITADGRGKRLNAHLNTSRDL